MQRIRRTASDNKRTIENRSLSIITVILLTGGLLLFTGCGRDGSRMTTERNVSFADFSKVTEAATQASTQPETTTEPESTTEPETAAQPETTTEQETTTEPETTTEAETTTAPETTEAKTAATEANAAGQEKSLGDPDAEVRDYVANTNTRKFHYPTCSSVKDIKPNNRSDRTCTRDDLLSEGFVPCKRCNP